MRFIPTHCEICSRATLVRESQIDEGLTACQHCGALARVLPGASYAERDAALFADLAAALGDAGITPGQAELLAAELEPRSLLAPGRCLRRLVQALPSLG